ncbi:hypothetical protein D3C84_420600 [compost metagenome]
MQVGNAVIEAQLHLLVVPGAVAGSGHLLRIPGHAVAAQALQTLGQFRAVGHHHATFGAGDDLHRMKTEHGHRGKLATTHRPPGVGRTSGMGRVFDHSNAISPGQCGNPAHVAALPGERHGHQHFRQPAFTLGPLQLDGQRSGIEIPGQRVDVDKIHLGTAVATTVGRGEKGVRCRPQPIARAEPCRQASDVQGRRGIAHRHGKTCLAAFGHRSLKALDGRPLGQPVRLQYTDHGVDVRLIEALPSVRNHAGNQTRTSASRMIRHPNEPVPPAMKIDFPLNMP